MVRLDIFYFTKSLLIMRPCLISVSCFIRRLSYTTGLERVKNSLTDWSSLDQYGPGGRFWGVVVSAGQAGRIDAFLKRAHKWGFCKDVVTFNELLIKSGSSLFQKMQSPVHCLNSLLSPKKKTDYKLRNRHCNYTLPQCNFNVFKHLFVNSCLFTL